MKAADVAHAESSMFGFEEYASHTIVDDKKAIGLAIYEMEAFASLLKSIAEVGPEAINSFERQLLPEEKPGSSNSKTARGAKKAPKASSPQVAKKVFRRMPFKMALTLEEKQLGDILAMFANNKDYFFVVKQIRFQNQNVSPIKMPSIMVGEKKPAVAADPFAFAEGGFEGGDAAEGSVKTFNKGSKILEQVYGKEKIKVLFDVELLLMEDKIVAKNINPVSK